MDEEEQQQSDSKISVSSFFERVDSVDKIADRALSKANENFDSDEFVNFCAEKGLGEIDRKMFTVLLAPMKGFYKNSYIGKTQVRLALVESVDLLDIAPKIISKLFKDFSKL